MSRHFDVTVTTTGTSVPLVAATVTTPSLRFASRVTIQYVGTHNIYGGFGTAAADVSASAFGFQLSSTVGNAITLQKAPNDTFIDMAGIRIDSDTNGEKVHVTAEA